MGSETQKKTKDEATTLRLDTLYAIAGMLSQTPDLGQALEMVLDKVLAVALALKPKGLVLVTGAAGTGKSTTLAAMIGHLNKNERRNVITIEDPIEFLHKNERCIIAQRELGGDTLSFAEALKHSLRQDPDVILVGEMRDVETMAITLTAAETGHLVLSTLHTVDAPQTIERIVDSFPSEQQGQIRLQLSLVLQGVLSQLLLPKADGKGRVVACEVMIATDAIRNLIREGKTEQILLQPPLQVLQAGEAIGHLAQLS